MFTASRFVQQTFTRDANFRIRNFEQCLDIARSKGSDKLFGGIHLNDGTLDTKAVRLSFTRDFSPRLFISHHHRLTPHFTHLCRQMSLQSFPPRHALPSRPNTPLPSLPSLFPRFPAPLAPPLRRSRLLPPLSSSPVVSATSPSAPCSAWLPASPTRSTTTLRSVQSLTTLQLTLRSITVML